MTVNDLLIAASMWLGSLILCLVLGAWLYHRGRSGQSPIPSVKWPEKKEPEPKKYQPPHIGA